MWTEKYVFHLKPFFNSKELSILFIRWSFLLCVAFIESRSLNQIYVWMWQTFLSHSLSVNVQQLYCIHSKLKYFNVVTVNPIYFRLFITRNFALLLHRINCDSLLFCFISNNNKQKLLPKNDIDRFCRFCKKKKQRKSSIRTKYT